jgi:hypothetical protein
MLPISAILSAVKRKDRTDQYNVLTALYSLDAQTTPVTAKQVRDLLKLHLGKDVPPNVNDCLRKYNAYVEAADKGPPLKWRLTPNGVDHLRELSGLSLPTSSEGAFETDIGVICALEHPEFAALMKATGGAEAWREVGSTRFSHIFRETEFATNTGQKLRLVGTTATSMGLTAAAIATTILFYNLSQRSW